jgi:hypothetical protein
MSRRRDRCDVMLERMLAELKDAQMKVSKMLQQERRVRRDDEGVADALRKFRRKLGAVKDGLEELPGSGCCCVGRKSERA